MAKRILYFEIVTTKWAKEFLSSFYSFSHFIGNIHLVFNGNISREYMHTDKGVVNLSVPGAMRYYHDHGFDYSANFFSQYSLQDGYRTHSFSLNIDENAWSFSIKYGAIGANKSTNTISIPRGKDVYKIVCTYGENFQPRLVIVEKYADKVAKLRAEEQIKLAKLRAEEHQKNQALSEKYLKDAQIHMGCFSNTLEYSMMNLSSDKNNQTICEELFDYLEATKNSIKKMPYQDLWTQNWKNHLQFLNSQYEQYYDYSLNKISASQSNTIFTNEYGKIHEYMLEKAKAISKESADTFVDTYTDYYQNKDWLHFCTIDTDKLIYLLWFYALHKPFDSNHFNKMEKLFNNVFFSHSAEPLLASCFAMIQVATEDIIKSKIDGYTYSITQDYTISYRSILLDNLHRIASALMWMKAYKIEEGILQYMLKNGVLMNAKEQERLKLLSTSNGMDIHKLSIPQSNQLLNIRMDSLDWKTDEYITFFDNLSFQDKKLETALAIRDENKDIVLGTKHSLPSLNELQKRMNPVFDDEYGNIVSLTAEKACRISLDDSEEMEGFLATSEEVPTLGIFALLIRIGKKLNIKFYTLYLPEQLSADQQAKKAISMQKKLSPTITMWETSLKDTFLSAMEQILNASVISKKNDIDEIEEF